MIYLLTILLLLAGCAQSTPRYEVLQHRAHGWTNCIYSERGEIVALLATRDADMKENSQCPRF